MRSQARDRKPCAAPQKRGLLDRVGLREPVLRVLAEPGGQPVAARDRLRDEVERLLQAVVRLRAAEAQEARARLAEALAAQARDAEFVVRALQHEQREAVARDAELVADARDVREDIERRGGVER